MIDADASEAFVLAALQQLVQNGLAEWDRTEDGERALRLLTGETLVVGDIGITSKVHAPLKREAARSALA
jgi:hypothetical protein